MNAATVTGRDLIALLPLLILTGFIVLAMLLAAFLRRPRPVLAATLAGLALAFLSLAIAATAGSDAVGALLIIDDYAILFMGLAFASSFVIALFAYGYFGAANHASFYILLLFATLGASVLAASSHFASLFLGLELLTIALFALIAYSRTEAGIEAGIKYLVLAGVASSLLLFGMALVYARLGTLAFAAMRDVLHANAAGAADIYLATGLGMILAGLGFKLALVPFHMWTPDVYEGAPAPAAAFVATVSKGAALVLLLRLLAALGAIPLAAAPAGGHWAALSSGITLVAAASILAGNLLALLQDNIKRMLAYSSIAHLGYLLVALLAAHALGVEAIAYYLAAYFIAMIGAFGIVGALSDGATGRDRDMLAEYTGLMWSYPWLAGVFTAVLLSLAGIPLTMGFVAKFYIVAAGVDASLWLLVIMVVIGSVIGLFYYLRIVATMCEQPAHLLPVAAIRGKDGVLLAGLTGLLVVLGVFPAPLIRMIAAAVG